jgi:hypothetical protein
MMNEVETLLSSEKVRNIFNRAVKNYFLSDLWGIASIIIGDALDEYDLEDSPWETYEEFLAADEDERSEWCANSGFGWFETEEDAWEYYGDDMIANEYECFAYHDYGVEEFFDFLERYADISREDLNNYLNKNIKKVFKIDYRNNKNKAAAELFSGMLSGYFTEDKFKENSYYNGFKFNKDKFNFQENFDLACKFIDNTLSTVDKAEAAIIFDDIKERLIAA